MSNPIVTITMENGDVMKAELYPEIAPNTVNNFISLVKKGFYDGLIFHRVIPGFMIQSLGKDGTKSVFFTVAKPDMLRTIDVLNDNKDLLGIKKLDYDENVAKISVIGAGVRSHSGVAAKMFGALANAGINTEMVTTSEIRITALIDEAYADQAMRAIHETFLERV